MSLGFQCFTGKMRRKFTKKRPVIISSGPRSPERERRRDEPQKVYLRTKNSLLRAFLFIGCCLLLVSCFDKGDCLFANTDVIKVNLVNRAKPASAKKMLFTSVAPAGQVLFPNPDSVSTIYLVADPRKTEVEYTLVHGGITEKLIINYSNQTIVLSPDCGAYIFQTGLNVKETTFDSVRVTNDRLLNTVAVNIEILH